MKKESHSNSPCVNVSNTIIIAPRFDKVRLWRILLTSSGFLLLKFGNEDKNPAFSKIQSQAILKTKTAFSYVKILFYMLVLFLSAGFVFNRHILCF